MMNLEGKPFVFTASYFSSEEIHMWSHTLRSPLLTFLKIDVLVVRRQKLEILLVGYGVLSSLSSNDPEEGRTLLWEGILQKEVNYLPCNLLDFLPAIKIPLGWQNLWKVHGRISSHWDTGQPTNILAFPLSPGPCYLHFTHENEFHFKY